MAVLPSLATVADLANMLGRTLSPVQELQAQSLLDQASSIVRAYVRQDISRTTTTDTFTMRRADPVLHRCGGMVTLPQRPIVDIASVEVNGVATADWWQDGNDVLVRSHAWSQPPAAHRPPRVRVTYTHGWDPVPGDIAAIVLQSANRVIVNPSGIRSETVGGVSTTYLIPATGENLGVLLSRTEMRVLDRYRRTAASVRVRHR
ncbi:hypothetical protein [Streptomyces candidus]|uniref:Uncharacterized protein n=1 Tax=Streptomyces candidus TaxID=67283 RepID=A0A7X0LT38_9ACTN|nr:hypothetical protein [Streptomyces candidus]MBB6439920.1 hypothetical protein [Streptomyces candidus]GHH58125.1 hypothetical protein GCM10018773_66180 [Streptomyces candidus]